MIVADERNDETSFEQKSPYLKIKTISCGIRLPIYSRYIEDRKGLTSNYYHAINSQLSHEFQVF